MANKNGTRRVWGRDLLGATELSSLPSFIYVPPPENTMREREQNELRRPIVIDGTSLGLLHRGGGYGQQPSARGIWIGVIYFTLRGHKTIVIMPRRSSYNVLGQEYMDVLFRLGLLEGPASHHYTCSQMARYAYEMDGCIASNNQFRSIEDTDVNADYIAKVKELVQSRLLMPIFSDRDRLDFPADGPLGRKGITFEKTIKCSSSANCANHQLSLQQQHDILEALLELDTDDGVVYNGKQLLNMLKSQLQINDLCNFVNPSIEQESNNIGSGFQDIVRFQQQQDSYNPVEIAVDPNSAEMQQLREKLTKMFRSPKAAAKIITLCPYYGCDFKTLVGYVFENPEFLDSEGDNIVDEKATDAASGGDKPNFGDALILL